MKSISEPFIRRPVATILLCASLMLLGGLSYFRLPIAALPQVEYPTIVVSAAMSGASAETMASTVATPLERSLSLVPQLSSMTSSSSLGKTSITLQFDLGRNIDGAALDVQAAISQASRSLPKTMTTAPSYRKINPAQSTVMSLALTSETRTLTDLSRLADNLLVQKLSAVSGVGMIDYHGQRRPAVRIQIDPDALAARGLTLADVRSIVGLSTVNAPKGSLRGVDKTVAFNSTDQMSSAGQYAQTIVAYKNGAPIRISDIGQVIEAAEDINQEAVIRGQKTVIMDIHPQVGANVVETTRLIRELLPQLTAPMPADTTVEIVGERTKTIIASVDEVKFTLALSIALVVLVIFAFLRNAAMTIIASITIPLSLLGAFVAMYLLDFSLNNLSIMGLSIAVGFVVDDAIVVLENIARHREMGKSKFQSAIDGAREVGFTVASMTISLIAVFIPLLLMSGLVGRLFHEFAVTVTMAIIFSCVLSLTLAPMLSAYVGRDEAAPPAKGFSAWAARMFDRLEQAYARCLDATLRRQNLMLALTLAAIIGTTALYVWTPKGFFPQQDTGYLSVKVEGAPDSSLSAMRQNVRSAAEIIQADPDVDVVYWWVGSTPLSTGSMVVGLKPYGERASSAEQMLARLRKNVQAVPGAKTSIQMNQDIVIGGRSSKALYQYTLQGSDIAEVDRWSATLLKKLKTLAPLQDLSSDQQPSAAQATLDIDRDMASRFGVSIQDIDDALYDAFGQRQIATMFTQLDQYKVILEVGPQWQLSQETLKHLYVRSSQSNSLIPLSMLGTVTQSVAPITINHNGMFPSITLFFNLAPGYALSDATTAIQKTALEIGMPDTVTGNFQGTAQAFQDSMRSQPWLILAAVLTVYVILGVLYESPIHPLTIISTLPSAGLGALLALNFSGKGLDVLGMIGIILLIGIVKKNAIMIVDFALHAQRNEGMAPLDAIRHGSVLRFRPIIMTTMAALLGAVPLAVGFGAGSEMRQPLGIAIIGGLVVSQALTLFTTPAVYLWFQRLDDFLRARRQQPQRQMSEQAQPGPAQEGANG